MCHKDSLMILISIQVSHSTLHIMIQKINRPKNLNIKNNPLQICRELTFCGVADNLILVISVNDPGW